MRRRESASATERRWMRREASRGTPSAQHKCRVRESRRDRADDRGCAETKKSLRGRVTADARVASRRQKRFFVAHSSFVRSETLKRFGKAVGLRAGSRALRTWNWSSLHMGGTDTRGYLGAREALNVLGLRW